MADENKEQQQISVDETPISPIRPNGERRNSLEQHLKQRPDRSELIESTIASILPRLPYFETTIAHTHLV